jgi:hypothetical protein
MADISNYFGFMMLKSFTILANTKGNGDENLILFGKMLNECYVKYMSLLNLTKGITK